MKLTIVGGGSNYTPACTKALLALRDELPVEELVLVDVNPARLELIGGLARRMAERAGGPFKVTLTTDLAAGVEGAEFIISQIRVGGQEARILDERIPLKYGIPGHETVGPGGFSKALRTIPEVLKIAKVIEERAPQAWLINYTNPSGLVTEALASRTRVKVVGLCDHGQGRRLYIGKIYGVDPERISFDYVGLNHMGWITRIYLDGRDITEEALVRIERAQRDLAKVESTVDGDVFRLLHLSVHNYLKYIYHYDRMVREETEHGVRAEKVLEIEKQTLAECADPNLVDIPPSLRQRGGQMENWLFGGATGYGAVGFKVISALYNNKGIKELVNTPNLGTVECLEFDQVAEVMSLIDRAGVHPLGFGRVPLEVRGLIRQVKDHELLTIEAAVTGDYDTALKALMIHPLVLSYDKAKAILDEYLAAHRRYLPAFFKG